MARDVETADYFKLTINRLTPEELGVVIRDLAKRGIFDVLPELITDVVTFKGKSANGESLELLEAWSLEHLTFTATEAVEYFKSTGRGKGSIYPALAKLVDKGVLVRSAQGMYRRAEVKQLAPPKAERGRDGREYFDVNHREFILRYARQHHGRFSLTKLREHFVAHKRKPKSIGSAVAMLRERKLLKPVGDGEYVLLAKGTKTRPAAAKPVANGNGAHIETPATEG
jgi:hypothetical protein